MGVVRSISREESPPGSLISSQNVVPFGWADGFMRISQRPATNEFCDTGTGTPIQGMCQVPIIIQPGGVILAPGVYNLASFTNSPLSTNGNVLNGNTGTSTIVVAPQSLTISATLQLEGNTVATWDGGGTNPTLPIYLNAEFWVFYDDNDFPPSLPAGVTMSIGGTWLTISTGPGGQGRLRNRRGGWRPPGDPDRHRQRTADRAGRPGHPPAGRNRHSSGWPPSIERCQPILQTSLRVGAARLPTTTSPWPTAEQ